MITVIIPTFNRSDYIERAINSVLNQTYQDFEIIIVDDNNPNTPARINLEKKMKKYKGNPKIHYVQHEKNKNGAAARNTGIKMAKGEYISFLDDDDFYISTRLETLLNALEKNPGYSAAYSDSVVINQKKEIVAITHATKAGNISKELLLKEVTIGTGSNLFFRADALKEIGGFDETFKRHQDIEVLIRFCQKFKILNINEILVVKDNGNGINTPKNVDEMLRIKENYMNSFKNFVEQFAIEDQNKFYFVHFLEALYFAIRTGEADKYNIIRDKVKKYGNFNIKIKLKLLRYRIYIGLKLDKLKEKRDNKKNRKTIDETLLKEIKNMMVIKEG